MVVLIVILDVVVSVAIAALIAFITAFAAAKGQQFAERISPTGRAGFSVP
jgi:hypothetical protein